MPASYPNYTGVPEFQKPAPKRRVAGVNGSNSLDSMLGALTDLGLCTSGLEKPLKTLAANGQVALLGNFLSVDIHELDRALAGVEVSTSNKIAFKSALTQMGFLK